MDVQRWIEPEQIVAPEEVTFFSTLKALYKHIPLRAMLLMRFGSWCKSKRIRILPLLCQGLILRWYGLDIGHGDHIGGGLYIAHPVGVTMFPEKIGENCSIIASVTIGLRGEQKFPRIGNNVFIGAGARVLGDVELGDHAVIGANAVVIKDVPAKGTVVGIPAKLIKLDGKRV